MTSLSVCRRAVSDLHHKGKLVFGKIAENGFVHRCPQVIGVGDKSVPVASLQQGIQHPTGDKGRVNVTVARRTPFQIGVLGPGSGA